MSEFPEIPGYRILEKIGVGSTATVWRARQESLDRDVAIKILHPELWSQMDEADAFLTEAHAVALLKSRHVIQVFDVGRLEDTAYIVMEFVAGKTLAQHLDETGKMPPREALQIVAAIADALGDAWQSQGIIHRDIKPDNIIIEDDGSVKLADLGLARQIDLEACEDEDLDIAGTPNYMSPEQATGAPDISFAADMYSLGATLYYMLTGRIPFAGMPAEKILEAQLYQQLPWPQDIDLHIPLSCCQLTARLMMKNPQDRYKDWNRVYADALKLAEGRMLMIKLPYDATSTIASAGKIPTGHKKVIRVKRPSTGTSLPSQQQRRDPLPAWLARTLHVARFAAILALLWGLLLKPILDARKTPATPPQWQAQADRAAQADSAPLPDPDEPMEEDIWTEAPYDELADIHAADMPPQESQPVKQDVLELLLQQRYREARQYWQQHGEDIADREIRETMTQLLAPENQIEALIGTVLTRWSDRTIQLETGGRTAPIQIETVNGDTVQALIRTQSGPSTIMRPYAFRISQLPPTEQIRLLENSSSLKREYAIGLVALQGADFEKALEMAQHMGPLDDAVTTFAHAQIERLAQP